jgi:hypothetical protein
MVTAQLSTDQPHQLTEHFEGIFCLHHQEITLLIAAKIFIYLEVRV